MNGRVDKWLLSPDVMASTLLVITADAWGLKELTQWHPKTIRLELNALAGMEVPLANYDKLMAAICIVTTDFFFRDVRRFMVLANTLAGDFFDPSQVVPPDAGECAWAVTEALLLSPPTAENPEPFSDEVRHFIGAVLKEEGFVKPPDILRIALDADFTEQVRYNFSDDPEMFAGIYAVQAEKTTEIETIIKDGLRELMAQLQSLHLVNGTVQDLVLRIGKALETQ